NAIVPWPGPVPAPGPSKVIIVGRRQAKGVLLKLRKPSFLPSDAPVAGVSGAGLAAAVVCDSAKQTKRTGARRKRRHDGGDVIGPLTQDIIVDLRCMSCFMCCFCW